MSTVTKPETRVASFVLVWWDAFGNAHQSQPMDKVTADVALTSMHPSQGARLVLVYRNVGKTAL